MNPSAAQMADVAARFGKRASLATILPQVAGPVLGGYAGRALASRLGGGGGLGEALGTIGGVTLGRMLTEQEQPAQQPASYALDPTDQNIPAWAMQGARYMRPVMKQGSADWTRFLRPAGSSPAERPQDVILGEIPGYSTAEGYRHGGTSGALKGTLGQVGGAVGGGALGYGGGVLLSHLLGRDVNIPLVNMPLSHLIAGLGATIGGAKGFQHGLGLNH